MPADFAQIAHANSDDPASAAAGGDLGYFAKGEMVEAFESAVFAMGPGDVSGIIETPLGFHIAKLYEKRAGLALSYEEVKDTLSAERVQEIRGELLEKFVDSLHAAATIVEVP